MSSSVKAKIALKLVSLPFTGLCESRQGNGFKKPQFPELPSEDCDLSHFVGKDSWSFFKILRLGHSFLHLPVDQWNQNSDWMRAKSIVDALCVANDAAEREVKLSQDFHGTAKEEHYQNIL